ncbi:TPA: hypothetical protein ACIJWR_003742, partial [Citrobacter sedlakii]
IQFIIITNKPLTLVFIDFIASNFVKAIVCFLFLSPKQSKPAFCVSCHITGNLLRPIRSPAEWLSLWTGIHLLHKSKNPA